VPELIAATSRHNGGMSMSYVDGFIVAVPKKNLAAYRRLASKAGKVWREHGALEYREWVADDVQVGKRTSFPRSVKLKPGETVVFSWITYKSRAQRDRVNAKVMADKRLAGMMDIKSLPFDAKRMIFGGFESLVKA
jgi:prepilin-type processing-associated H-X9-DG protein